MLSYRHIFHAGNFADVLKHAILGLLVQALKRKDKPFFYLDTHAGCGRYDLQNGAAQKNCEHLQGIAKLWERPGNSPLLSLTWIRSPRSTARAIYATTQARPDWYGIYCASTIAWRCANCTAPTSNGYGGNSTAMGK